MTRKEAIEIIKSATVYTPEEMEALETLIPELHESEEEKIWKELIYYHREQYEKNYDQEIGRFHKDAIAYLKYIHIEAQKGENASIVEVLTRAGLKPYKDGNQWCILAGDNIQEGICGFGNTVEEALYQFLINALNEQKDPKPKERNGEDTMHLTNAILAAEKEWGKDSATAAFLKSLPNRFNLQPKERKNKKKNWNPSKKQLEYLEDAIDNYRDEDNDEAVEALKSLLKRLEKMRTK